MAMRYKVNGRLVTVENSFTYNDSGTVNCLCCDDNMIIRKDKRERFYLSCPACGSRLVSKATEPIMFFLIRQNEKDPDSVKIADPNLMQAMEETRRAIRAGERMKAK